MHYLVATDSVHTTAAACDYLEERLEGPEADSVTLLTVTEGPEPQRDAGDAANVARARLAGRAALTTETREGEPARVISEAVTEVGADVLVLGPRSGTPGAEPELGSTAQSLLADTPVPAVVVPLE